MDYHYLQNSLYQNAAMGITALKQVIPAVKDSGMKKILLGQYHGYQTQGNDPGRTLCVHKADGTNVRCHEAQTGQQQRKYSKNAYQGYKHRNYRAYGKA